MTPTQRSKKYLQDNGYKVAIVERWNSFARIRQDLFGFIDLLGIRTNETLGVQTTSTSNMSARRKKIEAEPNYALWRGAGNKVVIHGWAKRGARGKRKIWELKTEEM